ncbi:unnamed protein product, partial [marine sediment metagenome]
KIILQNIIDISKSGWLKKFKTPENKFGEQN